MKQLLILPLLSLLAICSCRTATCETIGVSVSLDNFDSSDIATVKVTSFKRGTGFTEEVGHYVTGTSVGAGNGSDTLKFRSSIFLSQDLDKVVFLPVLGREFKIRDLIIDQKKRKENAIGAGEMDPCSNGARVYINDELHVSEWRENGNMPNIFHLKK